MAFITRSAKKSSDAAFKVTLTGQSHFILIFWLRKVTRPNRINSVKWLWWILTRWPLFCKSGLCSYLWNLVDFFTLCKKSAKWFTTVQCTLYTYSVHRMTLQNHTSRMPNRINSVPWMNAVTSSPYHECTHSHQLRAINERSHTNSVPWMHAVCRLRQVTFISLTKRSFWPTAYIHGTEMVWLHSFMVRSWWDLVKWPYGVQKSA
jgi:hypothetical protein